MKEKMKFVLGNVENIVLIGENADYQHFLLLTQCIQVSYKKLFELWIVWQRVKHNFFWSANSFNLYKSNFVVL